MVRKDINQAANNLSASVSFIPERYEQGIKGADWQGKASTDQAESNFNAGMQKALQNKSRQKGVKRVSNADWQNKSITLGKNRIASGITENLDKYKKNFDPVLTAMNAAAAQVEGKRTVDPMSNIDNILKPVVAAAIKASPRNK